MNLILKYNVLLFLIILSNFKGSNIYAQTDTGWIMSLDSIKVDTLSEEQLFKCGDTVNYARMSISDIELLETKYDELRVRWLDFGMNRYSISELPSMEFYVFGMHCNKCLEHVKSKVESIKEVIDVTETRFKEGAIIVTFSEKDMEKIVENVIGSANELLPEYEVKKYDEVNDPSAEENRIENILNPINAKKITFNKIEEVEKCPIHGKLQFKK